MTTLLLTRNDVRGLTDMPAVIAAVEEAYRSFGDGKVDQPPYMGIHLSTPGAEIDFKAGYSRANELVSLKASSGGFRDNPDRHGVPNGMGTVMLFDGRSGALVCIMDGSLLTGLRTGAAGAISVRAMARPDARSLAVIGTGSQARMQVRAIREVMQIETIRAWGRSSANAAAFAVEIEGQFDIPVTLAGTAAEAAADADVVVTTTRASEVVLRPGSLKPGTHVVAIGTDQRGKRELDPELFRDAYVVVDSEAQCAEKGEVQHAIAAGIIEQAHAEIGQVLLGRRPGRTSAEQITIFDSTGMAIQDNVTAAAILALARERGVGMPFDFLTQTS
ncbi:ornithine cyclodeaminase family protein [Palleronia sp. LCG004]|uniref:ornithine cyclodeaminase family protein n=1 Tax=Palleronia sp. LCG004 TaxID=3079304 RepID=UPI002943626F|nr:ornithine cyclodeaminase family protein [Palleronia sp. LCG004]WOI55709.1 ornithine cyclodeaminase family protein [Palleronia sp. LCG004]